MIDLGKNVFIEEMEFRKFTLNDEIWLKDNVDMSKIFSENVDIEGLSRIMFRQLVDKSIFPKLMIKDYNEAGEEIEINSGGLTGFRNRLSGEKDKLDLMIAFSNLLAQSRPEIIEDAEEKTEEKKKKSTGGKS